MAAAFHIENNRFARVSGADVLSEKHHEFVRPNDFPPRRYNAQTIAVAVKGEADIGADFGDFVDQVLEVFRFGGVGMVVREVPVYFAKQRRHLTAKRLKNCWGYPSGYAITAINHDIQRSLQFANREQVRGKFRHDVDTGALALSVSKRVVL